MSVPVPDSVHDRLAKLGVRIPDVLLPAPGVDHHAFAVIACDQFTSQADYWKEVASVVGDSPSALHCVLPEVYLEEPDVADRIDAVQKTAASYVADGVLAPAGPGFVVTERILPDGSTRQGLVLAIDLEAYDFSPGSTSLIRATEQTILDRLPPRVRIREGAAIELPHIMIMIDDTENHVFSYIDSVKDQLTQLYDTPLMLGGGRITGRSLNSTGQLEELASRLEALISPERLQQRYGTEVPLLFPVGDGNHSLAAARTYWLHLKNTGASLEHPARYALVEIVNLHGQGMSFHPIHRLVRHITEADLTGALETQGFTLHENTSTTPPVSVRMHTSEGTKVFVAGDGVALPVASVDAALEQLSRRTGKISTDYVHDLDSLEKWMSEAAIVLEMPAIDPNHIIPTVVRDGVLPRKAFSIGAARDKRYYLEARKIRQV